MAERRSKIRALLDERGMRYQHFFTRIGLSKWQFNRIENGLVRPPPSYFFLASLLLNLPEDQLYTVETATDVTLTSTPQEALA